MRLLVVARAHQLEVAAPRVEVGGVRVVVLGVRRAVEVEDELVGREVDAAVAALDALGPRAVVACRLEEAVATPATLVVHLQRDRNTEKCWLLKRL